MVGISAAEHGRRFIVVVSIFGQFCDSVQPYTSCPFGPSDYNEGGGDGCPGSVLDDRASVLPRSPQPTISPSLQTTTRTAAGQGYATKDSATEGSSTKGSAGSSVYPTNTTTETEVPGPIGQTVAFARET